MRRGLGVAGGVIALALAGWMGGGTVDPETRTRAPAAPSVDHAATVTWATPVDHTADLTADGDAPEVGRVDASVYRPSERLVRLTDPMDLDGLVASLGLTVQSPVGRSGLAVLHGSPDALALLDEDPRVALTQPHARVYGSSHVVGAQLVGSQSAADAAAAGMQWHLPPLELPHAGDYSSFTVAVLDSGVAYETARRSGVDYQVVPGLAQVPIRAPYDFVNGDAHANDDHQHGTHIASIIASEGALRGVTPGVGIMPVKVLGADNAGTEYALVEGIWHAVDNGADVINLSVSFAEGYHPSRALVDALDAAHAAGIVMIAATGNSGTDQISWPAASPLVTAVTASRLHDTDGTWTSVRAGLSYANGSSAVDFATPGGVLDQDVDGNGVPDGILAESIRPGNPSDVGVWVMAGTSQAAAVASGLAVELLSRGTDPHEVRLDLQRTSNWGGYTVGAGICNLGGGRPHADVVEQDYSVAMMPTLRRTSNGVTPVVEVTIVDEDGPVATPRKYQIEGQIYGPAQWGRAVCTVPAGDNRCTLWGREVHTSNPEALEAAWTAEVQGIYVNRTPMSYRPTVAITVTDALQAAVGDLDANGLTQDALLAWSFTDRWDPDVGNLAASYAMVNHGTGFASLPLGLLVTPRLMNSLSSSQSVTVAGTHDFTVEVLDMNGTGLSSIPLGLRSMRIVAIDGTGLASLPLGLRAGDMLGRGPIGVRLGGVGLASLPLGLQGTPIARRLELGGWTASGYGAASALGSSTALGISAGYATEY